MVTYGSQRRQIGSWYADEAWFSEHSNSWFLRGGHSDRGSDAGMFAFHHDHGQAESYDTFRLVLAV